MRKITPHLWFDKEAREAAELYTSLIPNSKITNIKTLHNTPSGDCEIVSFELSGQPFMAISAGPLFKFNPSVSFHVNCKTKNEVDAIFEKLSVGGKVLMPLGSYPFSDRYGWLEDKYGLSWQVILAGEREMKQRITPVLMFVGRVCGKTEEAVNFYAEVFKNSAGADGTTNANILARYGKGEEPDREGTVRFTLLCSAIQVATVVIPRVPLHCGFSSLSQYWIFPDSSAARSSRRDCLACRNSRKASASRNTFFSLKERAILPNRR